MSKLQVVLYRSITPQEPPPRETPPSAARKEQRITWQVPAEVVYGPGLTAWPAAVVPGGNNGAAPAYSPPLNERRPGFGDHSLTVTVPGNAEYNEAKLVMPLHVKRAPLRVTALPGVMQV